MHCDVYRILTGAILFGSTIAGSAFAQAEFKESARYQATLQGTMDSGGAGITDIENATAWYIEKRPVRYCICRDDHFSIAIDQIEDIVKRTLETWISKIKETRRNELWPNDPMNRLETRFQRHECSDNVDLRFFLGVRPPEIPNKIFDDPNIFAYADSTSINKTNSWKKGYIYVRKMPGFFDDDKDLRFSAIMLHEIGHIFGNSHIPETIMDKNILIMITDLKYWDMEARSRIDVFHTLNFNLPGTSVSVTQDGVTKTLKFVARSPIDYPFLYDIEILTNSPEGTWTAKFKRNFSFDSNLFNFEHSVFRTAARGDGGGMGYLPYENLTSDGTIEIKGEKYAATYFKNLGGIGSDRIAHRLAIFKNGEWQDLFAK